MKKATILFLAAILALSLTACGNGEDSSTNTVTKTEYMDIEGIYVDNTYADKNNDSIKLVYLFYTASTPDKNLKIDSKSAKITIGVNTYQSTRIPGVTDFMQSYYYSDYLKEVFVGDSIKVVETFKIPMGDLDAGKNITFEKQQLEKSETLLMTTDDILFIDGAEELAKLVDTESYDREMEKRADADESTTNQAKSMLNGYYWTFYVNSTSYKIEFSSPNIFTLTALGQSNSGTYTVKNGYISCKYDSTGYVVNIPYAFTNDDIELDATAAFDVR